MVLIGLLLSFILACQTNTVAQAPEDLVGDVTTQQLFSSYPDFLAEYQAYQPSSAEIFAAQQLKGKSITVLFGAWCHDSEREVPRLLKLLDAAKLSQLNLQLIAVNHNKQEPTGAYRRLDLRYTPTIILFDGENELGRIIERPNTSLGEDLADLLP
jgi:thiol-disulfide isomerase/thioredoxin